MKKYNLSKLTILLSALASSGLYAATTASYTFDGTFGADSTGTNDLTASGASQVATSFPDGLGAGNVSAASFSTGADILAGSSGAIDSSADFTVEGFFNLDTFVSGRHSIYSEFLSTTDRGAEFFVDTNGNLTIELPSGATGGNFFGSGQSVGDTITSITGSIDTVALDTNYYFATVFETNGAADDSVTFYLQDLTNGGSLQSTTIARSNHTASDGGDNVFTLGGRSNATGFNFNGTIDEIRISDTALIESELFIVPEASSFAFIGGFCALGALALRRRR